MAEHFENPQPSEGEEKLTETEKAWREAAERLVELGDAESGVFWQTGHMTSEDIEEYIRQHEENMKPQEKFFLDTTLQVRRESPDREQKACDAKTALEQKRDREGK